MATQRKTARGRVTYPVATLSALVTSLDLAIARVLAKPKKDAVHELRKATRRIEAQLQVMAALGVQEPVFAAVAKPARRVAKLLKRVRQAAGAVRDLDVQRKLMKGLRENETDIEVRQQAKELRREWKPERKREAETLVGVLEEHALELEPRLERLLEVLDPAAKVGVSPKELEVLTRDFYGKRHRQATGGGGKAEQMHGVRKAAKLARYMAEDGAPERVVHDFETRQETGGRWHDALTLRDEARRRLGRRSRLAKLLSERESEARAEFTQMLTT